MAQTMKRPASSREPPLKRPPGSGSGEAPAKRARAPGTGQDERSDDVDDQADAGAGEADVSTVTGGQRHSFKRALNGIPGLRTTLPPDVKEKYEAAQSPRERAAVINSVVPKTATYSWRFDATTMKLTTFKDLFVEQTHTHSAHGVGRVEMEVIWGYGNRALGKDAVDAALATNELRVGSDGLLYKQSRTTEIAVTDASGVKGKGKGSVRDLQRLEATIDWKAFAITPPTTQQLAIQAQAFRVPPSINARAFIEEASSKSHAVIREARNLCQQTNDVCESIEAGWLAEVDDMLALGIPEKSTKDLKCKLSTLEPKCQEVEQLVATLKATLARVEATLVE